MDKLSKIRKLYELKKVYRYNSVQDRKESSAEHSWSCLMLADYFLSKKKLNINRLKVYELLMYHDLVEIEAGDTPIDDKKLMKTKLSRERKASKKLKEQIPEELKHKFISLFNEYAEQKTIEARFAKAIDKLDALMHELDNKKDWIGWNEKKINRLFKIHFDEFKDLKLLYDDVMDYVKANGYLNN